MISFERFTLDNGLKVLFHRDTTTTLAAMNILYDVGARDENESKTGFAHLFEHLMFGGSVNIPSYDEVLQVVGGENNAYTTNDITNYYLTLPVQNIETAFWLESDRMMDLAFSKKSLEVQRQVVIEEFKQRYLNQPYGDVWLELRPLAYRTHPYKWSTIGKEIKHIEDAKMEDVRNFFERHYKPNNAILCIAGNLELEYIRDLCEKWFLPIKPGNRHERKLPPEDRQKEYRRREIERNVPQQAIYMAFHMCDRRSNRYYATDLASDILCRGESSRLYQSLVKERKMFTELEAFVTGDMDEGLFIVEGKINGSHACEEAESAVFEQLSQFAEGEIPADELHKVKNKVESNIRFGEENLLNRAMSLCMAELIGDANLVNEEFGRYDSVKPEDILRVSREILVKSNCSSLYYKMK